MPPMYDTGKVITGLVVALILLTFPFWFSIIEGKAGYVPEPELPKDETSCIESTEFMRANHMDLLNQWRDAVVRKAQRVYVSTTGQRYEMSLSKTCMKCHVSKTNFCDSCHNYLSVSPYCWDCHVSPEVAREGVQVAGNPASPSQE
jgi:hypothetical protein